MITFVLNQLQRVKQLSHNQWQACCPCHEDRTPSLSIKLDDNGKILLYDHGGCSFQQLSDTLHLRESAVNRINRLPIVAQYEYRDAANQVVRRKLRLDPKDFRIDHPNGAGWEPGKGPAPDVLYRLPEVLLAKAAGKPVIVVEGEKDADRLCQLGWAATTNIEGASGEGQRSKWKSAYTQQLAGCSQVILIPDNDAAGQAHMQAIKMALQGEVADLRVLQLPELPAKGDISDWLKAGHDVSELPDLWQALPNLASRKTKGNGQAEPLSRDLASLLDQARECTTATYSTLIADLTHSPLLHGEQEQVLKLIKERLGIPLRSLRSDLEQATPPESRTKKEKRKATPAPQGVHQTYWRTASDCTQLANANRIKEYYRERLWYAQGVGWIHWNGRFWQPDHTQDGVFTMGFVKDLSTLILEEVRSLSAQVRLETEQESRERLLKQAAELATWAVQSENKTVISSSLQLAKYDLLLDHSRLDTDPMYFNVQNGTIDLTTGKLRPFRQSDLMTHIAPVMYQPDATCPAFEQFLLDVFNRDQEMIDFIQRAVGWSLTGVVEDRALFFLYGEKGKNGKSTFVETIQELMGICGENSFGYARKVTSDTFMRSRNFDDNQRKAAQLVGPRFICTSEVSEEQRLNEQLIKDITGGDTLEARRLYQESFTFRPQFKTWMYGNHKPIIRGTDDAIWSRVKLIPFEVSFAGHEDQKLACKLRLELPGILNWAIAGCLAWQRDGLQPPDKVQAATQDYRQEMDVFGLFIEECCQVGIDLSVASSELWSVYKTWCATNGMHEENQTRLGRYLTARGFVVSKVGKKKRLGLGLRRDDLVENNRF